jgi:fibronectin type III domain protein
MRATRFGLVILAAAIAACNPYNGTAKLNWTAVHSDLEGVPLKDLAGYKVYYGASPSDMRQVAVVPDPARTSYTVEHLAPGTWYFTVAAYTKGGAQGNVSNVISKTVR